MTQNVRDRANSGMPWSQSERETLAMLAAQGCGIPEIATALGRSQEAIRRQATASGLIAAKPRRSNGPAIRARRSASTFLS